MAWKVLAVSRSESRGFGSTLTACAFFGAAISSFALFGGCGDSGLRSSRTDGGVGGNGGVDGSAVTSAGGAGVTTTGGVGVAATGGAGVTATGGAGVTATGGAGVAATGGAGVAATGGAGVAATGGAGVATTGGAGVTGIGGAGVTGIGGAGVTGTGGAGAAATGGAGGALSCSTVVCPSIPSSCKKIVQDPSACCPACTDTGCDPCPDLTCTSGTHLETAVGACCPTCVADPPNACTQGQESYASMRASMLTKYSSLGCKNSSDCVLVAENNLCVWNCNIPLPSTMSSSFVSNLSSAAQSGCATCPTPAAPSCEQMVPACVNGKCIAANPS